MVCHKLGSKCDTINIERNNNVTRNEASFYPIANVSAEGGYLVCAVPSQIPTEFYRVGEGSATVDSKFPVPAREIRESVVENIFFVNDES